MAEEKGKPAAEKDDPLKRRPIRIRYRDLTQDERSFITTG
jgi:hypothetical protein